MDSKPLRSALATGALLALPLLAVWLLTERPSPAERAPQDAGRADWSALVIGPARGQIEPCGCSGGQLGGIDRIATVLGMSRPAFVPSSRSPRLAAGGVVALEAAGHPAWTKAQAEVLWQSLSALGFDAVGLGSAELELLATAAGRAALPILLGSTDLVASNLVESAIEASKDSPLVTPAPLVASWRGAGLTMLSFLLAGEEGAWQDAPTETGQLQPTQRWRTLPLEVALTRLAQAGAWSPETPTLAFFEGSPEAAARLAERLSPESFVLLVEDEFEATERVESGGTQVIHIGSRLRQVLRLSGGPELDSKSRLHQQRVFEDVPSDPSVGYLRGLFRMMLQAYEVREEVADSKPAPGNGGYVGSASCLGCHQDAYEIWQETLHHQAWETLELDERDGVPATVDPRCVRCHSVGYGAPGGFGSRELPAETRWSSASPLSSVGCESCHGPGGDHITSEARSDIELGGEYTCLKCHDAENDPGFRFEVRWDDISHGREQQ